MPSNMPTSGEIPDNDVPASFAGQIAAVFGKHDLHHSMVVRRAVCRHVPTDQDGRRSRVSPFIQQQVSIVTKLYFRQLAGDEGRRGNRWFGGPGDSWGAGFVASRASTIRQRCACCTCLCDASEPTVPLDTSRLFYGAVIAFAKEDNEWCPSVTQVCVLRPCGSSREVREALPASSECGVPVLVEYT